MDVERLNRAKDLFRRGVQLLEQGDTAGALAAFDSSRDAFPSKQNSINAALCLERLERLDEALQRYEEVVTVFGPNLTPEESTSVRSTISRLSARFGVLVLQVADSTQMTVRVDDKPVDLTSASVRLRVLPGQHSIDAMRTGFQPFHTVVAISGGTELPLKIQLTPLEPEKTGPAMVSSAGDPGILRPVGPPPSRTIPVVTMIAGGVLLATGAVLGLKATSDYKDAEKLCTTHVNCSADATGQSRSARTLGWVSTGFFGAGIVAGALGGYLFVRSSPHQTNVAFVGAF